MLTLSLLKAQAKVWQKNIIKKNRKYGFAITANSKLFYG